MFSLSHKYLLQFIPMKTPNFTRLFAAAAALLVASNFANAADAYWGLNGTGLFTDAANWNSQADGSGTTGAPGTTNKAYFNTNANNGNNVTATLNATLTIGGFVFDNTGTTAIKTDGAGNRAITLGSSGITVNSTAGAVTFGGTTNLNRIAITINGTQTWLNNGTLNMASTGTGSAFSLGGE